MVHPGAIYLHQASTYLVDELDWKKKWRFCARFRTIITRSKTRNRTKNLEDTAKGSIALGRAILVSPRYFPIDWLPQDPLV